MEAEAMTLLDGSSLIRNHTPHRECEPFYRFIGACNAVASNRLGTFKHHEIRAARWALRQLKKQQGDTIAAISQVNMGMMKAYQLRMLELVEHKFGQDAIEHALNTGALTLTFDFEKDSRKIMQSYDVLCETYRNFCDHQDPSLLQYDNLPDSRPAHVPHAPDQRGAPGACPAQTRTLASRA